MKYQEKLKSLSLEKQAIYALAVAESKLARFEKYSHEPIAIVGMNCKFPGNSNSTEAFWSILEEKTDAVGPFPKDRWDPIYFHDDPDHPGKTYARFGGYLDDITGFDAHFFGISSREASSLDPQQRLLLETAWHALEDAGIVPASLNGSLTGVFVGIGQTDYGLLELGKNNLNNINAYSGTGTGAAFAAGRLAYILGAQGPAMSVDTACSSALVAVHQACASLRAKEANLAIVGGVHLMIAPEIAIALSKAKALSPTGRCRTFSDKADGYVRGEGCGVVILKRLSDAVENKDAILAVIRGSAVNHDGPSGGLTVPNGKAQEALIRAALTASRVLPEEVSYMETHGTGTPLGDPIEIEAIANTLCKNRSRENPLVLGAVKTNIGHLEPAAGMAGLIKVVMAMQKQRIPANLHFEKVNPYIPLEQWPIKIPVETMPWHPVNKKRIAGLSAFGLSGTNAHVILEESLPQAEAASNHIENLPSPYMINISAKHEQALMSMAEQYRDYFREVPPEDIASIAYHMNVRRTHFKHRLSLIASDKNEVVAMLDGFMASRSLKKGIQGIANSRNLPKIAFLFAGQGCQYPGMGRELYEKIPFIRAIMDDCIQELNKLLPIDFRQVLFASAGNEPLMYQAQYAQPLILVVQYAIASYWMSLGVKPQVVAGHSAGEYAAACVAGIIRIKDALKIAVESGKLVQTLPAGKMITIGRGESEVRQLLESYALKLDIGAVNHATHITVSGEAEAIKSLQQVCKGKGIPTTEIPGSHAYHSYMIEEISASFEEAISDISYSAPTLDIISSLTGQQLAKGENMDAAYWARQLRETVRFDLVAALLVAQYDTFVEAGPNTLMLALIRQQAAQSTIHTLPSIRKSRSEWEQMLHSLASLYVKGVNPVWEKLYPTATYRPVSLPLYAFNKQTYWTSAPANGLLHVSHQQDQADPLRPEKAANGKAPAHNVHKLLEEIIFGQILEVTDYTGEDLEQSRNDAISELGLDSLLIMNIRAKVMEAFPETKNAPMKLYSGDLSIDALIQSLREYTGSSATSKQSMDMADTDEFRLALSTFEVWEKGFDPGKVLRIDQKLVHKDYRENVLIARIEQLKPDVIIAEINQDLKHKFFYEHAKDHVTGIYMLEAISQLGRAMPHLYYQVPMGTAFIISEVNTSFVQFAETSKPLFVLTYVKDKVMEAGTMTHLTMECFIVQSERVIGKVSGLGRLIDEQQYHTMRHQTMAS